MHLVDGVLAYPVVLGGAALAVGGIGLGLRRLDADAMPAAGMLAAGFFVASLIHLPLGPVSIHLALHGLLGLVLGWVAFPVLFVSLLLQALFFGYGGLTVLGVNTLVLAAPAVLLHYVCRAGVCGPAPRRAALWGGLAGAGAVLLSALAVAAALLLSGEAFLPAAKLAVLANLPLAAVEGALSAVAVYLVRKVRPELFGGQTQGRGLCASLSR